MSTTPETVIRLNVTIIVYPDPIKTVDWAVRLEGERYPRLSGRALPQAGWESPLALALFHAHINARSEGFREAEAWGIDNPQITYTVEQVPGGYEKDEA